MTIEDKISQLLPSFLKKYDGNKDSANEGTIERYQKMLASEIDAFFLASTDNLHENTKAVTMPTKFLPYEEYLRGTSKLVFEFTPFVPVVPFDQTNLVFDFDYQKTSKQTLRDGTYLTSYIDRGVTMVQATASAQPTIDATGLKFDGVDDFMITASLDAKEIWFVCNSLDGATFTNYRALVAAHINWMYFYVYGIPTTSFIPHNFDDVSRINNIVKKEFSPLSQFKSFSMITNVGSQPYRIGWSYQYYWNGYIKRILIFDQILSEERRTALQAYLTTTYGL